MNPTKPDKVTMNEVLKLDKPTTKFLCKLSDNTYGIKFGAFKIRDMNSGFDIVDIKQQDRQDGGEEDYKALESLPEQDQISFRTVKYHLGPEFLELKNIGTTVEFSIGKESISGLQMVERHYFKDKLLKSFEFQFGFCMPNSKNSWEVIYQMPNLTPEMKQQIIDSPWQTKSDSFYFVKDQLIMHQKAEYNYSPEQQGEQ